MAQITVKINGYAYTVACEDGQEAHLQEMAREVEQRIENVKTLGGSSGEGRLLVLAALLMADELHDTAIEMASLRTEPSAAPAVQSRAERDSRRITKLARKAEDIAARIEQP